MKRILIIRSNINSGGPASLIKTTISQLKKRDFIVSVACGGGTEIEDVQSLGADVQVFPSLSVNKRSLLKCLFELPNLRKYIIDNEIEVIYGFNSAATLMAYFATIGIHKNVKFLNALLGMGKEKFHKLMPFSHVCMSEEQKRQFINYGIPAERLSVLNPTTIDLNVFDYSKIDKKRTRSELGYSDSDIVVGSVMNGRKGYSDYVQVIKTVAQVRNDVRWLFVGNTEKYSLYKEQLLNSQYAKYCKFLGVRKDIPELMAIMDVFSHFIDFDESETFGMVLTEAMTMHTPVITNNYGGMMEIVVNEKTGFLVDSKTEYIKKLLILINDEDIRKTYGIEGHKRAKDLYTVESYGNQLEGLLKSL